MGGVETTFFCHQSLNGINYSNNLKTETFKIKKIKIQKLSRPVWNSIFNCHQPKGVNYLNGCDLVWVTFAEISLIQLL